MNTHKAQSLYSLLARHYPDAKMILIWSNPFELLIAIILSAQCTDKKVNEVTARIFPLYSRGHASLRSYYDRYAPLLSNAGLTHEMLNEMVTIAFMDTAALEKDIMSTGFYRMKAKHIQESSRMILDRFQGILPRTIDELTQLPGVGRKTANVFLTNAYHIDEGIAVDTHVKKQALTLGLTRSTDPVVIEQDLMRLFPQSQWHALTYLLIAHGRNLRASKQTRITCQDASCPLGV
jgi:endonuclease-3